MKKQPALITIAILTFVGFAQAGQQLTLEESKRLALQNNVQTKNSLLETEAARQIRRVAFTRYFPSINASGMAFDADKSFMEITTEGGNLPVYDGNPAHLGTASQFAYFPSTTMSLMGSMSLGMVTAVQPVFAGGRIMNGNKLAALGVEASEDKALLSRNEVLLATEDQYWRVVSLADKMRTIQEYEEFLRRLLMQVEDAYNNGLVMKNDVLKVKLKLSEVLLNKSKVVNGKNLAAMAFCQYIGIAYDPAVELDDPLIVDGTPQSYQVDHQAVLKGRPEYRLLEASVRAEELKTRMKLGEYLPQAGVGVAGLYLKMDETKGKTDGVVFGTLSIPLSGWWEASHALSEQKARQQIARNNLKDNSDLLALQMENTWQEFMDSHHRVLLCREASAQAEENLKVNQDSYDNGLSNISDLLEAQALLQQANDQLTDSMALYRVKLVQYLQVTGR
jgi:outer membrane protein